MSFPDIPREAQVSQAPAYERMGQFLRSGRQQFLDNFTRQFNRYVLPVGDIDMGKIDADERTAKAASDMRALGTIQTVRKMAPLYANNWHSRRDSYIPAGMPEAMAILTAAEYTNPFQTSFSFDETLLYAGSSIAHIGDVGEERRSMTISAKHIIGQPRRLQTLLLSGITVLKEATDTDIAGVASQPIKSVDAIVFPDGSLAYIVPDEAESTKATRQLIAGKERLDVLQINLQQGIAPMQQA